MAKEGRTGLTIRESTLEYVKDKKEPFNEDRNYRNKITWDDLAKAGMTAIEEQGAAVNNVTKSDNSKTVPIHDETYENVSTRKEAFNDGERYQNRITWDDIFVEAIDAIVDGDIDVDAIGQPQETTTSLLDEEEVREIVNDVLDERLGEIEAALEEIEAQAQEDGDGISEDHVKEIAVDAIRECVLPGALEHRHR